VHYDTNYGDVVSLSETIGIYYSANFLEFGLFTANSTSFDS
jgi:hypothetical protein